MPGYIYRAMGPDGKEKKGNVTATNAEQAASKLKADGLIVMKLEPESALNRDITFGTPRVKARDYAVFCRQFVAILKAGVSVINALQMMSEQIENKSLKSATISLVDDLGKGETLSSAMRKQKVFPSIFVNLVAAGEATGSLETAFERMALQFEKEAQLKAIIKKATIYPIIVLIVAVGVIVAMMTFVIPNFMSMFEDMDVEMPAMTKMVIAMSDFFVGYWWLLLIIVVAVVVGLKFYGQTISGRVLFGTLKIKAPGVGQLQTKTNCATFSRTLSTLLRAGVPMLEALEITGNSMDGNILFQRAVYQARDQVGNGVSLSKPIKMSGLFPPMVVHMVSIGEETGELEDMLENIAEYYEEEVAEATEQMMAVMEPLIIVVLAVIVGVIIMAILQPMLTLYDAVGNM
ncbi:MAG: type II secretion system F family protein [Lachnospiraceae bacterium]|nr:type II secretion system F family protein [Lachnospiraceae bacterium]